MEKQKSGKESGKTTTAKSKKQTQVKAKKTRQTSTIASTVSLEDKQKIIEEFAQKPGDTGSPEVQVALLTQKINRLTNHLSENQKDDHSRRGLLKVIAKRRRILNYLLKLDKKRYQNLIKKLNLKK
jgi:small subunit ribosomal protein S15